MTFIRRYVPYAVAGLALLAIGGAAGGAAALIANDDGESRRTGVAELNVTTITTTYDLDTQYVGKCGIVTPPTPDVCDAVQGTLRYSFFSSLVNADNFKKWKSSSPGDYQRLTAHMQAPACSAAPVGLMQDMRTALGAALASVVQAYACAKGTEPIVWPSPNPPPLAGSKDKTPPMPPGPITATPTP